MSSTNVSEANASSRRTSKDYASSISQPPSLLIPPVPPIPSPYNSQVAGPSPPPNGGTTAWLQVLGCFMLYFNTWGLLSAFGEYQTYYESAALFKESSSNISWIGSIQSLLLLLTGVFAGPCYDAGMLRLLLVVGSFLVVFGHMMLSICSAYWQVLLAQGVVVGLGAGCLFVPCVAILPQYFTTKLGLAIGLISAGSAFGGVIYPIVLYRLIDTIGFGWSTRVIGFIALGTLLIPLAVLKYRVQPPKVRAFVDLSAFTDVTYMAFVLTTLVAFMGLFTLLFFLSFFAESRHITDSRMAAYVVAIFNVGSLLGRTIPNAISDKTGPFNLIAPGTILAGVFTLCLIAVKKEGSFIVLTLLSGFISGVVIGLPPLCFVAITRDKSKLGTRMGMGYAMVGLGVLAGGPGAGGILGEVDPLDWRGVWIFSGVACVVAGFGYAAIRVAKYGPQISVKA
ncbi:putative MFS monocarboxylate transporter [Myriangium duriaei CBS 260.36]|uniref:MFS monocarboxylate transporter n=1 Tax=Myriangium duriaei CBS 260.36 TaxID=1168546 RepID=A0A9P4J2N8_9PEZI|nr:putative MFS monocarboxylate transporter [Myriangium duriaei CBS 260.36]